MRFYNIGYLFYKKQTIGISIRDCFIYTQMRVLIIEKIFIRHKKIYLTDTIIRYLEREGEDFGTISSIDEK